MSRTLFTHSLPLVAAEQCYQKIINDTRNLLISTKTKTKQDSIYQSLLAMIKKYNEIVAGPKVTTGMQQMIHKS